MKKFIDEATHGVILFTLGSAVKGSALPLEKKRAFLEAFSSIKQRVLWKFEEPIDDLPENIMLSNWLPQRDILGKKKTWMSRRILTNTVFKYYEYAHLSFLFF